MNKLFLELEGNEYPLITSTFSSNNRRSDAESYVGDNNFSIQIKIARVDKILNDWIYNTNGQTKNGKIVFINEFDKPIYEICFVEAQTSNVNGNFNVQSDYGNDLMVTLNAKSIYTNAL